LGLKITNYLKNLGKSVKYAAAEGFKTNYDTTYKTFDQASTATKETVSAIVNYRQTFKKAQEYLMKSTAYEASNLALKSAKEDLKSGKLWNQDRADKIMFGGDDDDFDWNFDEDISGDDSDSSLDITTGDKAIAKTVHDASRANADQISGTIMSAAKYNADVTKQTASFMFAQQERLFGNLNNSIMGLGTTMGNMQNFMTTNMQTHIENSTKYFEESTKYQRENNAILKELLDMERERFKDWNAVREAEKKRQDKGLKQDITDILSGGIMDWGAYGKHIKKGFVDQAENLGLGMISKEMLMGMAANPMQFIPAYLVQQAMGKPLEKAIGGFNKTLTGLFNQINADLLRSKDKEGVGGILANIFSVKVANKDKIDTSKYVKGQVPFDGMTRKSIVEVIPAYLARIESLLGGEERVYDFDKGKFSSMKILEREKKRKDQGYKDRAGSGIRNALQSDFKQLAKAKGLSANELKRLTEKIPDIEEILWDSNGSWDAVMERYGDDQFGKILRFLSTAQGSKTRRERKTLASEYADGHRSKGNDILREEKATWSAESMLSNRSRSKGGTRNLIAENNDLMSKKMDEQQSIFKAMLSELYLIRTSGLRKGKNLGIKNRLNSMAVPDYIDNDYIKYSVLKENRAVTTEEALAHSDRNKYKAVPLDPNDKGKTIDELDVNKLGNVFSEDKGKFDDVTGAKGLKGKGKAALSNWSTILRNPRLFAAEVITKVDDNLYKFFFDHETGEKDEDGNQIRGFYDKMAFELKTTFTKVRDWLDKKLWEPIVKKGWGKVKDFAKSFGLDWFSDAKSAAKDSILGATNKVSEMISGPKPIVAAPSSFNTGLEAAAKQIMYGFKPKKVNLKKISAAPSSTGSQAEMMAKHVFSNGYAFGSLSVPETALTTVSKGELIIPSELNPFNPDLDKANSRKDKQDELRLKNKIFSHAEGGNQLQGKNFLQTVKDKLPNGMVQGNTIREVVGSALEFAVGRMAGKVESTDGSALGQVAKASVSTAWETGLDKFEDYAKTLDPEISKSLTSDIAKLRGNTAKFAGRTGVMAGAGALGATAIFGPGGLLAGAAVGAAANIIRESDTAKNFLFGEEMADGSRAGGLISRKQQALFKKYMPDLGKGAAAGIIPSLMLGFGPVGAIAIGGAYSLAKNNKKVNERIFGKTYYDKDGNEIGRKDGIIPKKVQDYVKKNMPKIAGFGGAAALLDPTGMGLLMNFGLGAGLGLIGTSSKFHDMVLGKKNEKGEREGGLVGALKDHVVNPLRRFGTTLYQDFYKFMDYNLFSPLKGTGKMIAQSFKNMGRSLKYGMFNILEKAFGGPFSMLIGKQLSDMVLRPVGRVLGRSFSGIGDLTKFVVGAPIRGIGSGLRKFNNWGNAKMIRKGQADHLSAQERLNIMGSEDYSNKTRDQYLAGASAEDLTKLESSLSVMKSQFKIGGGEERKAVKRLEDGLKKYLPASVIKQLARYAYDGDERGAMSLINGLDIPESDRTKVISIFTKEMPRIQVAIGKKKYSNKEIENAKAHLKSLNIDPTDRKSLGIALDQVSAERDRAETAERLIGKNGEKFTSEEAKNVAEGMQSTNSILEEIRDNLIKNDHGGNDDQHFDSNRQADLIKAKNNALKKSYLNNQKLIDNNFGHLKVSGSVMSASSFTGKGNKSKLAALKALPESMEINLDQLAKLDTKTIKRYSQLAMVMGPIAIKSIGDPSALAPENLADGAFESIIKIATYLSRGDKKFEFTEPISKYIRMPEDKLKFLATLVGYGMNPAVSAADAEWAWQNRSMFDNGDSNTKVEFAKSLNKGTATTAAGVAIPKTASASQAAAIASTSSKQRYVDENGNEVYESTDGSRNKADTESAHDKKKEEDAKDEKNAERQGNIFSKALGKIKGFGSFAKDGAKEVKEKSQGFLHDIVDSVMGKGGLFGGLGTILGGGLLLSFIGPMLPEIGKILTHTLLPAIGGFLKNTVMPMVLGGLKSTVGGLLGGLVGREEKAKTDENGNIVYDKDGNPEMEVSYNPSLEGMLFNGGVLGFLGYKGYKVAKGVYDAGKAIVKGAGKVASGVGRGFRFGKALKQGEKFKDAWKLSKATKGAADIVKDAEKASSLAKAGKWADFKAGFKNSAGLYRDSAMNAIKSTSNKALNFAKDKFTPSKVASMFEKTVDVAKNASAKVLEFLKTMLTKGIEKISEYIPKLAEKGTQIGSKVADLVLAGIKNSAKFGKLVAKASAYVGVSMTGIGAVIIGLITALDLGYSVTRGIESWYNVAEVLADETPPNDDVKWLAGFASALDSVLFSVLGPEVFFKILAYVFGASDLLAPLQERAQKALSDYNSSNNSKFDSIADFNDEVVMKGQGGFWNDAKKMFGFEGAKVERYAEAPPAQTTSQGAGKSGKTSNGGLLGGMGSKLSNLASKSSGLLGQVTSQASELQAQVLGTGKYFKQNDPKYAGISFNTSGDSINQTIGDSGCGPVAGANALMALGTGTINPAEASNFAISGGYKGTDTGVAPSFFEGYAASHGATSYSTDASGTINALKSGNPVVLQGESKSGTSSAHPFGSYPHYVTATGYDARTGKVTIQDPESNRDNMQYNIRDVLRNTTTANAFGRGRFGRGKFGQGIRFGRGIEGNVPIIWNKLQGLGFGDIHTAAIMGNMAIESGFDPAISEYGGGGGFGLCQWDDRKGSLAEYAQRAGKDPSDLDIQLQFIKYELQGSESAAAAEFFAETSDIDKATEIFCTKYERPYMPDANLAGRKQAAREILQSKGTGKVTSIAGGKAGASGPTKRPGLLSPLFDMYNSMKSNLGSMLGIDLGGNIGGSAGASGGIGQGAVGGGNTKAASNWADSIVGKKDYGNNGCTSFVNEYLQQAGQSTIDLNCDNAYTNSKEKGLPFAWKPGKDNGVEGDVALINTAEDGSFPDGVPRPDHAVIADGRGGYWGYSASQRNTVHGKMTDWGDGGSNIIGYIASGGSGNGAQLTGSATMSQTDMMKASSDDYGLGKNGLKFGRAKGVSKEVQMAVEGRQNFEAGLKMAKDSARQAAKLGMGTEGLPSSTSESEDIILLRAIYTELTKITGNTAGIGTLQANQAQTAQQVTTVQNGLQGAMATLGNKLNEKINMVSQNIQGQVNKVTKNVSGNTINQLQYLASK
jgi:hypothetical protein